MDNEQLRTLEKYQKVFKMHVGKWAGGYLLVRACVCSCVHSYDRQSASVRVRVCVTDLHFNVLMVLLGVRGLVVQRLEEDRSEDKLAVQ